MRKILFTICFMLMSAKVQAGMQETDYAESERFRALMNNNSLEFDVKLLFTAEDMAEIKSAFERALVRKYREEMETQIEIAEEARDAANDDRTQRKFDKIVRKLTRALDLPDLIILEEIKRDRKSMAERERLQVEPLPEFQPLEPLEPLEFSFDLHRNRGEELIKEYNGSQKRTELLWLSIKRGMPAYRTMIERMDVAP